jgi:uroporphyrinogen-III decarboxylase
VPTGDPGLCSFGEEIDIARAIKVMGDKNIIIGNIDPRVILAGKPDEIYTLCKETIKKGKLAPRGSCSVPVVKCHLRPLGITSI